VALISAVPIPDPAVESKHRRIILKGDVPNPASPPAGCHFHTRCWLRERLGNPAECVEVEPQLRVLTAGHQVACHFAEQVEGSEEQRRAIGRGTTPAPAAPRSATSGDVPVPPQRPAGQ
jgi:peptide/nickel transport system ATP-binding protein